ncbi:MAG: DUF368 domain-containing protein [Bacilli bacterium]|nr:DUF368 domain-containing protein [Bacilli bacterium]
MKKQLTYLWKGSLIGVGLVAPGASGGVFATILGLYDTLINAAKTIFTHPFKIIKELWGLLIGILIGAIFSFYVILTIIRLAPIPMTMLIVGFILGSAPKIYKATKIEKRSIWDYILMAIAMGITIALPFLPSHEATVTLNIGSILILFAIGFILAATLVIPGLSGSMILMLLGFYFFLVETIDAAIGAAFQFDIALLWEKCLPLIPFAVGVVVGLFVLSKMMSYFLKVKRQRVYATIFGLLISSPFSIIYAMTQDYPNEMQNQLALNIVIGLFTLILGIVIGYWMDKMESKYAQVSDL